MTDEERDIITRFIERVGGAGAAPAAGRGSVPGTAVTLMPDDIHSIHLGDDGPHANLHLYGKSVEHCDGRLMYSRSKGTCKTFPPATGIGRARGAD